MPMNMTSKGGPATLTIPITLLDNGSKFPINPKYQGNHFTLMFPNGYGVSIIDGYGSYTSNPNPYDPADNTYEVAILHGTTLQDTHLCYATPVTSDVLAYQTLSDLARILFVVSQLPPYAGPCDHQSLHLYY